MTKSKIEDVLKQPLKSFKADLHIHTPASHDFYMSKTSKAEKEYLAILRMAKSKKVSILGITDHSSIDGFIELRKIRQSLHNKLHTAASSEEKKLIEKKIKLFESVLIVPGIEVKTQDGVEYIVLFDPENPVGLIKSFLDDLDFDASNGIFKIASTDLTNRTRRFGCINIAAHVDSNNGAYNITNGNPTVRMRLFKDPNLDGMHFSSPVTCDKIKSIFGMPQYRRESPLAFIKCSDFHNKPGEKVGREAAYFKLGEPTFLELARAFENPVERVSSPATFNIKKILDKLLSKKNKLCMEKLNGSNKDQFLQYASAYSNSNGGYVLIGVSEKGNLKGIDIPDFPSVAKCLVTFLMEELDPSLFPFPTVIPYPYGEKLILSIFFPRYSDSIVLVKSEHSAYELREKKPIVASSAAIMNIVTQKVKLECLTHLESNRSLKIRLVSDINRIEDSLVVYPLLKKIVRDGKPITFLVNKPYGVDTLNLTGKFKKKTSLYLNGNPTGTVAILDNKSPRYQDTCLRYSAPTYRINNISRPNAGGKTTKGCMILCSGDAYVLTHAVKRIVCSPAVGEVLVITVASLWKKNWPAEYIVAFLKSSPFLWYALKKFGDFNLVRRQTFLDLRIPSVDKETRLFIAVLVRELCRSEKSHITEINKLEKETAKRISEKQKKELEEKILNLIDRCNKEINNTSLEIDNIFYEKLNINEEEQEMIQGVIEGHDLYVKRDSAKK